jgi:hypothetical protein
MPQKSKNISMQVVIPIESASLASLQVPEAHASCRASASCYRLAEYVGFLPVVKTELKFVQVERQKFLAHVVVRANDSGLEQRPVVNEPAHVLAVVAALLTSPVILRERPAARRPVGEGSADP